MKLKIIIIEFILFFVLGFLLYNKLPSFNIDDKNILYSISKNPNDIINVINVLEKYKNLNHNLMILIFSYLYLLLQSFAIPGTIFLSILSGPIFGVILGFILVSLNAAIGSTICYLNSKYLFKDFIIKYKSDWVKKYSNVIKNNNNSLFFYLLFLRVTPIVPNIVINLVSPVINIRLRYFFWATFLGLMPLNIIHLNTGITIKNITNIGMNYKNIIILLLLGLLSLIPIIISKKSKIKFN